MKCNDDFYLAKIQERGAYKDENSKEQITGVQKMKYKVSGGFFTENIPVYVFFNLTTNESACNQDFTISIESDEWEQKEPEFLNKTSFLDITKAEGLNKSELLQKLKNKNNQFVFVAKLPDKKFKKLKKLQRKRPRFTSSIPKKKNKLISKALDDDGEATKILKELGLQ